MPERLPEPPSIQQSSAEQEAIRRAAELEETLAATEAARAAAEEEAERRSAELHAAREAAVAAGLHASCLPRQLAVDGAGAGADGLGEGEIGERVSHPRQLPVEDPRDPALVPFEVGQAVVAVQQGQAPGARASRISVPGAACGAPTPGEPLEAVEGIREHSIILCTVP